MSYLSYFTPNTPASTCTPGTNKLKKGRRAMGKKHDTIISLLSKFHKVRGSGELAMVGSNSGLVAKLCLTLYDPMGCSPPGSSIMGFPQARILEWAVISFSRGSSTLGDQTHRPTSPPLQADSFTAEARGKL